MGSRHLGGDEELEVSAVWDSSLVEVDEVVSSSLLDLLGDNGLQHGIESLSSINKNDGVTESEGSLKLPAHDLLLHAGLDDLHVRIFALGVCGHQPVIALHLGVDHEGPSVRVIPNNSVLSGEGILG